MERGPQVDSQLQSVGSPEPYRAFIPFPLPPKPELAWNLDLTRALSAADLMLGRLDGISRTLPDINLLIYFYSRKEAVLSSQIEGTQSTLAELLLFEANQDDPVNRQDLLEVSNYVAAMDHGLARLRGGFPLSLRLLREMHQILMRSGRGSDQTPGEFRRSQNWIGGKRPGVATYVPPPVMEMNQCLDSLEKFLHEGARKFPPLIQAALVHVQFESIHPFLDGNGRLGRLLIALLLIERKVIAEPLLYPSLYLKQNRPRYYELLQEVRFQGNWEEWITFFLEAIATTAEQAVELAETVLQLFRQDERKVMASGIRRGSIDRVYRQFQRNPIMQVSTAVRTTQLSLPTVIRVLEELARIGILREITGKERNRIYRYEQYVNLLNEGTEL